MFKKYDCVRIHSLYNTKSIRPSIIDVKENGDCLVESNGHITMYKASDMKNARLCGRDKNATKRSVHSKKKRPGRELKNETKLNKATKPRNMKSAYIYMAQFGNEHVKIGRTQNVKKRMKNLQTAVPYAVNIIKTWQVESDKASQFETDVKHAFHKQFHHAGGGTEVFLINKPEHRRAIGMINRRVRKFS